MKKILSIIMAFVVLLTYAFFAVGSLKGKLKPTTPEEDEVVEETIEVPTEPTKYEPDTTAGYIKNEAFSDDRYSKKPSIVSAVSLNGSILPSSNVDSTRSFGAEKTIDKQYDTCWCVNTTKGGEGAKIRFNLREKSYVEGFMMVNGNLYQPDKNIFKSNGQVKNFTLTFSDGSSKTFTAEYNEFASRDYEYFHFDSPVITDYIILTVNSGYVGQKYTENVAIGEVNVF